MLGWPGWLDPPGGGLLLLGTVDVEAECAVHLDFVLSTAQQLVDRHAQHLAVDVPQCLVDGGQGGIEDPLGVTAELARQLEDRLVPHAAGRYYLVEALQQRRQVVEHDLAHPQALPLVVAGQPDAPVAGVGLDRDEHASVRQPAHRDPANPADVRMRLDGLAISSQSPFSFVSENFAGSGAREFRTGEERQSAR